MSRPTRKFFANQSAKAVMSTSKEPKPSTEHKIDLMHNDVKQCFHGTNVHCGTSCSHEQILDGVVFRPSGKFKLQ